MVTGEKNNAYPESSPGATEELRDDVARPHRPPEDGPSPMQMTLLRAMSGQQRLKLAEALYWEARKLKRAGVRHQHPGWPEERVTAEVNRIFLNARS